MKTQIHFKAILLMLMLFSAGVLKAQTVTVTLLNPVCNHDGVVVASIPPTGGVNTFTWYDMNNQIVHVVNSDTDTLFNFSGGYVWVQVLSSTGVSGYGSLSVPFPFNVITTIQPDTCPNMTGAIDLNVSGGNPPYTYSWLQNGVPFGGNTSALTGLPGGFYDCTITDASGCEMNLSDMDSGFFAAQVPSVNSIVVSTSFTAANCTNGTATATVSGGTGPYTYLWSNGQTTATITGLYANTQHTVTVTDAQGCFKNGWVYIQSSNNIIINPSVTNAHCTQTDGAITAIPTGGTAPYSYLWNTFATTNSISNIPAGNYIVTVTDVNGCIRIRNVNVVALTPVNTTTSIVPSVCTGATGSASLNITGGTSPYSIQWQTNPPQSGTTATGLAPGAYNFIVTDAQGCTRSGAATVTQNTTLAASISTTSSTCSLNNGTATLSATGGVAPYSYLWSGGQTTQTAVGLSPQFIYGTVTDANGCHFTYCKNISLYSPLQFTFNVQHASCIFTPDGTLSLNIQNGTPPYTYSWSTGATTPAIAGLLPGYYSVHVSDANGCSYSKTIYLSYNSLNPCSSILQGYVFQDLNGNCTKDAGETGLYNVPVHCITTNETDYTDPSGFYSLIVPVGNVDIRQNYLPYRHQVCPSTNPFTVNIPSAGVTINQDIADSLDVVQDLEVRIYNTNTPPRVGFTYQQTILEINKGTITQTSDQELYYDSQGPYSNASIVASNVSVPTSQASWINPMVLPFSTRNITVNYSIPPTVPINTTLTYVDTIFPIINDVTWWDNAVFRQVTTVGSYDPNYKEVIPAGSGPEGYISQTDSVLEFVVHFQNIGNYYAQDVVILDTLDPSLDRSTLEVVYATHAMNTSISAAGVVKFEFNYINLPGISQDTLGSNGFLVYRIKLLPNLPNLTEIRNTASIYFDFNAPVITNTTLNTILYVGVEDHPEASFNVYPNPGTGYFFLEAKGLVSENVAIRVFNVNGQVVYNKSQRLSSNRTSVDLTTLPSGVYTMQIEHQNGVLNSRLVLIK